MKFPKQIFVTVESVGEDHFLNAQEDAVSHVELGEVTKVAVYTYLKDAYVSAEAKVEDHHPGAKRNP